MVVLIAVTVFAAVAVKRYVEESLNRYTSLEAEPIEAPTASPEEIAAAIRKFDDFQAGMTEGPAPVPLSLTGEELNLLLFNHPELKSLAGTVAVAIANDRLDARVSVPLDRIPLPGGGFFEERVKGKFLNAEVGLSLRMLGGRPALYAESVSVNGSPLPASFMSGLRAQNLLEEAGKDPEAAKLFDRIEEMKIEGDRLVVVPRPPAP